MSAEVGERLRGSAFHASDDPCMDRGTAPMIAHAFDAK